MRNGRPLQRDAARDGGNEASGWTPGKPTALLSGDFDQRAPAFSPDGRWLAYESNQSGQYNVYVRPFPGPGSQWQISTGGGVFPTWSRTRHELLYSTFDRRVMVVGYSIEGESFHADQPRPWPAAYTARALLGSRSLISTRRKPARAGDGRPCVLPPGALGHIFSTSSTNCGESPPRNTDPPSGSLSGFLPAAHASARKGRVRSSLKRRT